MFLNLHQMTIALKKSEVQKNSSDISVGELGETDVQVWEIY